MIDKIKKLLKEYIDLKAFPGASFCVVLPGHQVLCDYIGYKRLIPYEEDLIGNEIYDVASLTKVISTTTLMMKLIEDGKLTLETRVSEVLPRFKHVHVTIYDLLTHASGLPADLKRANTLKSRQEVIDLVYEQPLIYETKQKIIYSDVGFILLGLIIEVVTKDTLAHVAKKWIFDPLNMMDTSYHPMVDRCAPTELREDSVYQGVLQGLVHDEKAFAMNGESGHAGLFSTAKDIALFMSSLLNKESVISPETIDKLFETQVSYQMENGAYLNRALGWDKPTQGGSSGDFMPYEDTIIHTGFTGCNMFINRKDGIGFVMLSNDVHPTRAQKGIIKIRREIANIIMATWEEIHAKN